MSSKQINFYITPEDVPDINEFLLANECIFIRDNTSGTKDIFLSSLINEETHFKVYLSKSEFTERINHKFLEAKEYYFVDVLRSYVIEFDLGGFYPYSNKELHRARFYYVFEYYQEDENTIQKDAEFIRWADRVIKKFKKKFLKKAPEFTSDFFSDRAIDWARINHAKPIQGGLKLTIT